MTPETRIKRLICSWLRAKGAFIFVHDSVGIFDPTRKVYRSNKDPYRIKGVSDILGIWKGKFLAVEVKAGKGKPSPEQKEFIENVNRLGGIGLIAWGIEDVERVLKSNETSGTVPPLNFSDKNIPKQVNTKEEAYDQTR